MASSEPSPYEQIAALREELAGAWETICRLKDHIRALDAAYYPGLSHQEAIVMNMLLAADGAVTREKLEAGLYRGERECHPKVIAVLVSRIRKKLGVRIHVVRSKGYVMEGKIETDPNEQSGRKRRRKPATHTDVPGEAGSEPKATVKQHAQIFAIKLERARKEGDRERIASLLAAADAEVLRLVLRQRRAAEQNPGERAPKAGGTAAAHKQSTPQHFQKRPCMKEEDVNESGRLNEDHGLIFSPPPCT